MPQNDPATIRRRAAELRAEVAVVRQEWLAGLLGKPLSVLAERDGTGHAENFARVRLGPDVKPGTIVTMIPCAVEEGLLA